MHAVRLPVRAMAAAAWVLFALVAGAAAPGVVGAGAEEPNGYVNRRDGKDQGLGAAVSGVIPITTENYEQTLKQGTWFVKFYTDWCKHCQRLQPTWETLATDLKGKVNMGQVNCDREAALCRRFKVKGYPTLVHIHNRKCRVYQKSRDVKALEAFATEGYKKVPSITALKSPFGPIENAKAVLVEAILRGKERVVKQIRRGTPVWVVCLAAVATLVVMTVVVALVAVGMKRPKQD